MLLIQINIFNNNTYYIEECLIKLFNSFILFEIFKNNKFLNYILIYITIIKIIIFIIFFIIKVKTASSNIIFLISNLKTSKNKESLIFIFNNFYYKVFIIMIINKIIKSPSLRRI